MKGPHLANRLKVARAELNLSQEELATLAGVTRQTICSSVPVERPAARRHVSGLRAQGRPRLDLLGLVIASGAVTTGYQGAHKVLSRRWLVTVLTTMLLAAALGAAI